MESKLTSDQQHKSIQQEDVLMESKPISDQPFEAWVQENKEMLALNEGYLREYLSLIDEFDFVVNERRIEELKEKEEKEWEEFQKWKAQTFSERTQEKVGTE